MPNKKHRDKDVIISVKGTQNNSQGDPNLLELVTEGKYYKDGRDFYLVYKETEITGMSGTTTTVKISPGTVVLSRMGTVNSQLIFEQGQKHVSYYDTVNGAFTIGVFTNLMNINVNEHGGELMVDYSLEVDSMKSGENDFHIIIREVGANE